MLPAESLSFLLISFLPHSLEKQSHSLTVNACIHTTYTDFNSYFCLKYVGHISKPFKELHFSRHLCSSRKSCTILPVHASDFFYRDWIHCFRTSNPRQIQSSSVLHFSPCCVSVLLSLSLTAIKIFHQKSKHSSDISGLLQLPLDLALRFTFLKLLTQYALGSFNLN